jgi:hypothetical protein
VSEPTLRTAELLKDMSSATVSRPTDKLPLPLRPTDDDWSKMLAAHVHMGTKNLDNKMVRALNYCDLSWNLSYSAVLAESIHLEASC